MTLKSSDIMTLGAATLKPDTSLTETIRCMADHRISALPVLDSSGNLKGMVSEGDFFSAHKGVFPLTAIFQSDPDERKRILQSTQVSKIMSTAPVTIDVNASLEDTIGLMAQHGVKRLPVVEDGKVVGLISRADILRALVDD